MICFTCLGQAKRICPACKKIKKMSEIEKERIDYLLFTWVKLKKYKMPGTNCQSLDLEVIKEFGDWRYREQPYVV